MPEYKFYSIGMNGHIAGAPLCRGCADDPEAMAHARILASDCDIEIWTGARLVAYVVISGKGAADALKPD